MYTIRTIKGKLRMNYPIIGAGKEGIVFKLSDKEVIKYYNIGRKSVENDIEVATRLESLSFKSYVRPYDVTVRRGRLYCNLMERLVFDKMTIGDLQLKNFLSCLKSIRSDTAKITDAGIKIQDLDEYNICISKGVIRIYDTSDYSLGERKYLRAQNNNTINDCFGSLCLQRYLKDSPFKIYDRMYSLFLKSGYEFIEDYLEETVEDKEQTVKEFVKKL